MISRDRLLDELLAAGLPVTSLLLKPDPKRIPVAPSNTFTRPEMPVAVDWTRAVTAAEVTQTANIIAAHDGTPILSEKLDGLDMSIKLVMAHNELLWARANSVTPPAWAVNLMNTAHDRVVAAGG